MVNDASGFKEAAGLDIIEGVLRTGHPVLVGMRGTVPDDSGNYSSHYVVIYGYEHYSDGGEFHYMRNTSKDSLYQDTIQQYMKGPWYIYDFTKISY